MSSIKIAKEVLKTQAQALVSTSELLNESFDDAIEIILSTQGRVVISGMGKSGIIGKKIAATLASTGTPSFFVHPGEAYHGDLGMFKPGDVAILISYSGETDEVIRLIPSLKLFKMSIIAMTGDSNSTLAKNSDTVLNIMVDREVCPNNLAPTTSTTVTLAVGDAVAVSLMQRNNFQPQDFARFHPGGSLGRRLLTKVKNVMITGVPVVNSELNLRDVIVSITEGGLGLTVVLNKNKVEGLITDGDLRRALFNNKNNIDLLAISASEIMTKSPIKIKDSEMLVDAENIMHDKKITSLLVVNEQDDFLGVVKIQDTSRL